MIERWLQITCDDCGETDNSTAPNMTVDEFLRDSGKPGRRAWVRVGAKHYCRSCRDAQIAGDRPTSPGPAPHRSDEMSKKKNPKDKPLTVAIKDGVLSIEIGLDTNAYAAVRSPYAWEQIGGEDPGHGQPEDRFSIDNPGGFALDMKRAMLDEEEDGSSPLSDFLDAMVQAAAEDGSIHFIDAEAP